MAVFDLLGLSTTCSHTLHHDTAMGFITGCFHFILIDISTETCPFLADSIAHRCLSHIDNSSMTFIFHSVLTIKNYSTV